MGRKKEEMKKPCPFCGCRDIKEGEDSSGEVYYVQCAQCKANIYLPLHPNIDEVKKDVYWLWNRRAGFDWQSFWQGFLKGSAMPFTWLVSLFRREK